MVGQCSAAYRARFGEGPGEALRRQRGARGLKG
jgi:hypothetical protein